MRLKFHEDCVLVITVSNFYPLYLMYSFLDYEITKKLEELRRKKEKKEKDRKRKKDKKDKKDRRRSRSRSRSPRRSPKRRNSRYSKNEFLVSNSTLILGIWVDFRAKKSVLMFFLSV